MLAQEGIFEVIFFFKTKRERRMKKPTLDSVSTLTSNKTFLYLYCAATSPAESPPFFTAVDVRA